MKKSIMIVCSILLTSCIISALLLINPFSHSVQASTISQSTTIKELSSTVHELSTQVITLETNLSNSKTLLNQATTRLAELENQHKQIENLLVDYYIDKLRDTTYIDIYNEEYIYYIAPERLGQIGKAAIPKLIDQLQTSDDYERALALYGLLLASQHDNVKEIVGDDYIPTHLDFDARNHPAQVEKALAWWEKYQSAFN